MRVIWFGFVSDPDLGLEFFVVRKFLFITTMTKEKNETKRLFLVS